MVATLAKTTTRARQQVESLKPFIPELKANLRVIDRAAVRQRARRRVLAYVLFFGCIAVFFAIAFAHAKLVASQQQLDELRANVSELRSEKANLERSVNSASAPQVIYQRAQSLGMIESASPVYLTESGSFEQE